MQALHRASSSCSCLRRFSFHSCSCRSFSAASSSSFCRSSCSRCASSSSNCRAARSRCLWSAFSCSARLLMASIRVSMALWSSCSCWSRKARTVGLLSTRPSRHAAASAASFARSRLRSSRRDFRSLSTVSIRSPASASRAISAACLSAASFCSRSCSSLRASCCRSSSSTTCCANCRCSARILCRRCAAFTSLSFRSSCSCCSCSCLFSSDCFRAASPTSSSSLVFIRYHDPKSELIGHELRCRRSLCSLRRLSSKSFSTAAAMAKPRADSPCRRREWEPTQTGLTPRSACLRSYSALRAASPRTKKAAFSRLNSASPWGFLSGCHSKASRL
eukprot:RCo043578